MAARKEVLMICYQFPPDMSVGSLRSRKYAEYLDGYGWACQVITAAPGRDRKVAFPATVTVTAVRCPDLARLLGLGVGWFYSVRAALTRVLAKLRRRPAPGGTGKPSGAVGGAGLATRLQRWLLLPDPQFLWIPLALPAALAAARRVDVIYSSAWPLSAHVLGLLVHKMTGKPWVADYRDEWTLNSQWLPPTTMHRWLGEYLDRACVKNAAFVVNVTEARTESFRRKYGQYAPKCVTIHNGYDESDVSPFRNAELPEEYMQMASLGSLYGGRDPSVFLAALSEVLQKDIPRNHIRVFLVGVRDAGLSVMLKNEYHLDDVVTILPRMPQIEAFHYLARSHVALLFGSDMEKVAMTTKVYEYAGMGKLIFALTPDGPVKDFVARCAGLSADPQDMPRITALLETLYNMYRTGRIDATATNAVAAAYERRALTGQLAHLLDAISSRH